MSGTIASGGVPLGTIFDPYVAGTTKARASGLNVAGNDLSNVFANILYGSAAAATGIKSQGADLNTLYAAYGTAVYSTPLPIDGDTYDQTCTIPSGFTGVSQIGFKITSGTTYTVYGSPSYGSPIIGATGSIPAGSSTVKITYGTYSVPVGDTDAGGSVTNPASSAVAVSSNPNTYYVTASAGSSSGSRGRSYPVNIIFYNSGGSAISTTNITLIAETDGSS